MQRRRPPNLRLESMRRAAGQVHRPASWVRLREHAMNGPETYSETDADTDATDAGVGAPADARSLSVACVVPVFNRPRSVIEALESIAKQSTPPAVLVVVDDGSTDDTAAVVASWIADRQASFATQLVRQDNAGAGAARNRGVREADAIVRAAARGGRAGRGVDLLAFLDSDDLWPADYLARTVAAMAASADAVAVTTDRDDIDMQTGKVEKHRLTRLSGTATKTLAEDGAPWTSNTVLRRQVFDDIGGYDVTMPTSEDWQLMLRMSLRGRWLHAGGSPVQYRLAMHAATGDSPNLIRKYSDTRLRAAEIVQRFLLDEGGRDVLEPAVWRQVLARRWYGAGRQMQRAGRSTEARRCYRQAARWGRFSPRVWWRLLTLWPGGSAVE